MTMGALFLSSCATPIHDFQACAEIPGDRCTPPPTQDPLIGGAVCDNFLTSNQLTLNRTQWQALKDTWESQGDAVVSIRSSDLANLKAEIEKLCSTTSCTYQQIQQIVSDWMVKMKFMTYRAHSFQKFN